MDSNELKQLFENIETLIKNIEWVGECDSDRCKDGIVTYYMGQDKAGRDEPCPKCNGTITRQATIEEVLETAIAVIDVQQNLFPSKSFYINNGQLRIKNEA